MCMERERLLKEIAETNKKLAAIESLLQRLPEIQAGVLIQMYEEYTEARLTGQKSSDLWTIAPPHSR